MRSIDPVLLIGGIVFVGLLALMVEGYRLQRKGMVRQREAGDRARLALEKQEEAADRGRLALEIQEEAAERGRLGLERQEQAIRQAQEQTAVSHALQKESIALVREMVTLLRDISKKLDRAE